MTFPYQILADTETKLPIWLQNSKDYVKTLLNRYGAILLRGFEVLDPGGFEQAMKLISPELLKDNGEHNRDIIHEKVYTPIFYSATEKVKWHSENSFNFNWPGKLFFTCIKPSRKGGETPLVDTRKFLEKLDPILRKAFKDKKIMYVRNYHVGAGLTWQQTLNVETKEQVAEYCRNNVMDYEWKDDLLITRSIRDAIINHPKTGEACWFAQPTHWHPASLNRQLLESLIALFSIESLPRNCHYGDGSPIETSVMEEIEGLYQELEVALPWEIGDVIMIDNISVAHSRNPFQGKRQLFICLGDMYNFKQIAENDRLIS